MTPARLDATFAALADPTRRAIIARLASGEASVNELAEPFAMSQPAISKHLKVLERAGLISRSREAQRRPRKLEPKPLAEATAWLERYRKFWEGSFQHLDALLDELKAAEKKHGRPKRLRMAMSFTGTLQVTTVGDREVRLVREFDAPRRLVWDCFTKPELVRRWLFGPDGWSFLVCDIDLRVGGSYRYVWRNDGDGTEMGMKGVYREVVTHERIVDAQIFDQDWTGGEAIGTVLFIEMNGRTTVDNTMLYASREARDLVLQSGMKEGMAMGYDRLEEFMATLPAGGAA